MQYFLVILLLAFLIQRHLFVGGGATLLVIIGSSIYTFFSFSSESLLSQNTSSAIFRPLSSLRLTPCLIGVLSAFYYFKRSEQHKTLEFGKRVGLLMISVT